MLFLAISDTHGHHSRLNLPDGDVIIHAGDVTTHGTKEEALDFLSWFSSLHFKYKIFIPGNHDFFFQETEESELAKLIPQNIYYLNDSGVMIENIKIWGSPVQPCYHNMAFNRERGEDINKHWDMIPEDIDILVTHGPAYGILDGNYAKENVGCKDLLKKLYLVKPKYYIFGHIHEAAGVEQKNGTTFINACILDKKYEVANNPVVFSYYGREVIKT